MSNIFIKSTIVAILTVTLFGCGGEADEAKKLGFASVEEMKEAHAKGWHTQQQYFKDNPDLALRAEEKKQQSASKESSQVSTAKVETPKKAQSAVEKGTEFVLAWNNDEFVECAAATTAALAFGINNGHDISQISLYSQTLSLMRKIKESKGVLTEQQFDSILAVKNAAIPLDGIFAPNRDNAWLKRDCIGKVVTFRQFKDD